MKKGRIVELVGIAEELLEWLKGKGVTTCDELYHLRHFAEELQRGEVVRNEPIRPTATEATGSEAPE